MTQIELIIKGDAKEIADCILALRNQQAQYTQIDPEAGKLCMPAQWTADVIGQMHLAGVTGRQLAEALGMTPEYVSMVLNGHRTPDGAEERFREAVNRLSGDRRGSE